MNHLFNITKKELKELLTPGSVVSIIIVMVMMMAVGSMVGGEMDSISSPQVVGIIDDDDGKYSDITISALEEYYELQYKLTPEEIEKYLIVLESDANDGLAISEEMKSKGINSALVIEDGFTAAINNKTQAKITEYYIFNNSGIMSSANSSINTILISYISSTISGILISEEIGTEDLKFVMSPVASNKANTYINGEMYVGITPAEIGAALMSQTMSIPLIIMIVITMIGSIVISSIGNEKENKTLETLLTLPVSRTTIVSGKLIASAITGLIFGMAYMIGMSFYMNGFMGNVTGVNLADYGLVLSPVDWVITGAMVFLAIFCALGLCMILGAFVKNYKAAQTMTLPITVLAIIPMFVTMFTSYSALPGFLQAIVFAIPFSHPMMVMNNLLFDNVTLVVGGLLYLTIFSIITIYLTVKIYKSDILLTGIGQTKVARTLSKLFSKKVKEHVE